MVAGVRMWGCMQGLECCVAGGCGVAAQVWLLGLLVDAWAAGAVERRLGALVAAPPYQGSGLAGCMWGG